MPVTVPAAGEYVAAGAARQAAWTLTGELPLWAGAETQVFTGDEQPIIRQQYGEAQRSVTY